MATSRTYAPPALSAQRDASGFARRCIARAALLIALLASQIGSMPVRPAKGQLWIEGDGNTPSASPTQAMAPSKTAAGNVASCSEAAFKAALAGGGLVTFSTGDCTIVQSSSAGINAPTTIDGAGQNVILSGGDKVQIITTTASVGTLTLRNITLANGRATFSPPFSLAIDGGAIYVLGALVLSNTKFIDNVAPIRGGGAYVSGPVTVDGGLFQGNRVISETSLGGGLYAGGSLALTGTQFLNNSARLGTGGVYAIGAVTITGGLFQSNRGGGLYTGGSLTLSGTQFLSNTAEYGGGGAYAGGAATLNGGVFQNNRIISPPGFGGGLYAGGSLTLTGTQFLSNTAGEGGGGALAGGAVTLTGGLFQNNLAAFENSLGGGLYAGATLTLTGTQFLSNTAGGGGGGAVASVAASLNGGRFQNNRVISPTGLGGGLMAGALTLTGTQFLSNTAGGAGGGAAASGDVSLSGGLFQSNASPAGRGGGLYAQGSLILTGTQFLSNTAALYGGGALLSGPATLKGGLFQSNASSWGGGLLAGNTLTLSGTQFLSNAAALYGGGAFAYDAATLNGGLFRNNISAGTGGGLVAANALALTGTQFINNAAGTDGGGLYLYTETTNPKQVVNALFARNRATGNGAAIYAHAAPFSLIHSTIVSPTAPSGATQAVYVVTGTVYLTNTLIASHTVGIEQAGSTVTEWNTLYSGVSTPRVGTVSSSGAITGPAAFVNPAADDYHLLPSSAAIDAGTTPNPNVTRDIDGDARPQQGGYDIGYDESPFAPAVVSVLVVPELSATLTTTSALVEVPAGAITQTITLVYEPSTAAGGSPSGTLMFAGLAFSLTAVQNGSPLSGFVFERPVTVTLRYTDADVMGLVEANLQPFYFNPTTGMWQTDGIVVLARRLPENEIVFTISHLTRFGLFAPTQQRAFIPVIMRGGSAISGVP